MKAALRFPMVQIALLIDHAKRAERQRATFEDLVNPATWKPGVEANEMGYVEETDIDPKKLPPSLLLVHDHGVYLMSGGVPMLEDPNRPGTATVTYAAGLDPNADYDDVRDAVGGDDFVERIPLSMIANALARKPNARELVILFSDESLELRAA